MRTMVLALGLSVVFSQAVLADPISQATVTGGQVQGVVEGPIAKFLGIRYGATTAGQNRWRPPQPLTPWSGVKVADQFAPNCWQAAGNRSNEPLSEDCLFLNVWTPAQGKGEKLPVLVWNYVGGFQEGGGYNTDGTVFAKKGLVVVTYNPRVGALGFMAHPELTAESPAHASGMYGSYDGVAMLKWVHDNIAQFGGDPNRVTIGGVSGGAGQVKILEVSPLSRGLIHATIVESGPKVGRGGPTLKDAEAKGVKFGHELGADNLAALRALPPEKIVELGKKYVFGPGYDGLVLPEPQPDMIAKGEFTKGPALGGSSAEEQMGSNPKADEMSAAECAAYIDKETGAYAEKFKATYLNPPSADCFDDIRSMARDRNLLTNFQWGVNRKAVTNEPTYIYVWNHPGTGPNAHKIGSAHGSESSYVWNNLGSRSGRGGAVPYTQKDHEIAEIMNSYWANFAKTGNPNGSGLPNWPAVDPNKPEIMELGDHFGPRPLASEKGLKAMTDYVTNQAPKTPFEGPMAFSR